MKKILSVLLFAAACTLTGCEPKEPEVEKAKLTIESKTEYLISITVESHDGTIKYEDLLPEYSSIVYKLPANTYRVHALGQIEEKSYRVELYPGDEKTICFSFKKYW